MGVYRKLYMEGEAVDPMGVDILTAMVVVVEEEGTKAPFTAMLAVCIKAQHRNLLNINITRKRRRGTCQEEDLPMKKIQTRGNMIVTTHRDMITLATVATVSVVEAAG
eukprot:14506615-Ditylum_brightwellii.AAC.1